MTMKCNATTVNNTEPMTFAYAWINANTSDTLPETSDTLILLHVSVNDIATYKCEVTTDAGRGIGAVTIELGGESHDPHVMLCVHGLHCFLVQLLLV